MYKAKIIAWQVMKYGLEESEHYLGVGLVGLEISKYSGKGEPWPK